MQNISYLFIDILKNLQFAFSAFTNKIIDCASKMNWLIWIVIYVLFDVLLAMDFVRRDIYQLLNCSG